VGFVPSVKTGTLKIVHGQLTVCPFVLYDEIVHVTWHASVLRGDRPTVSESGCSWIVMPVSDTMTAQNIGLIHHGAENCFTAEATVRAFWYSRER
jgi:hypothetical protein